MNPELRAERAARLETSPKQNLAIKAHRLAGYAMPLDVYRAWSKDELVAEILNLEFGPVTQ